MSSKEKCKRGKSQEEGDGRGRSKRTKEEEEEEEEHGTGYAEMVLGASAEMGRGHEVACPVITSRIQTDDAPAVATASGSAAVEPRATAKEEGHREQKKQKVRKENQNQNQNQEQEQRPSRRRMNKLQACVRLARLARKYGITDDEGREMAEEEGLRGFDDRYVPNLSLSAFDRLVFEVGMWRASVVAAARRAWEEGGGGADGSSFVPPAPRRPRSTGNEDGVGGRVNIERKRQLGQKLSGKVQPKRSGADLARLTEALGYPPGTEWCSIEDPFEQLVEDVGAWRAGVVAAARGAWEVGGGGADGSSFVPPAPRRPRSKINEDGVGVRVDVERKRLLGQKLSGKVQPKRSGADLARLTVPLGYPPGTEWWDLDEAFEQLVEDVGAWRAGVVAAARRAWEVGGGGADGSSFVPPAPRRPRSTGNEDGVGGRVNIERMRQLGQKLSGKVQPKRSGADLARADIADVLMKSVSVRPGRTREVTRLWRTWRVTTRVGATFQTYGYSVGRRTSASGPTGRSSTDPLSPPI